MTQDEHKVQQARAPVQQPRVSVPQATTPVRHLSDAERAELRRQLQQFNRQYKQHP